MLATETSHPFWQKPAEVSMRYFFGLLMAFTCARAQTGQPVVEVFLPAIVGPGLVLAFGQARDVVNAIYSEIGVGVAWANIRSAPPGCTKQPWHMQIVVAFG